MRSEVLECRSTQVHAEKSLRACTCTYSSYPRKFQLKQVPFNWNLVVFRLFRCAHLQCRRGVDTINVPDITPILICFLPLSHVRARKRAHPCAYSRYPRKFQLKQTPFNWNLMEFRLFRCAHLQCQRGVDAINAHTFSRHQRSFAVCFLCSGLKKSLCRVILFFSGKRFS